MTQDNAKGRCGMVQLGQVELVAAILAEIARQAEEDGRGESGMAERHFNAVIRAADLIVDEFRNEFRKPKPHSGITEWLLSDDTGLSSRELAACLIRHAYEGQERQPTVCVSRSRLGSWEYPHHPHDPADFGRCVRLFDACPELREHLPKAASISPVWAALVGAWDELEALYREEWPTGRAPKLYARMESLIDGATK